MRHIHPKNAEEIDARGCANGAINKSEQHNNGKTPHVAHIDMARRSYPWRKGQPICLEYMGSGHGPHNTTWGDLSKYPLR